MIDPRALPGLLIGAPASGSGKTTVTLGLLRALRNEGMRVSSIKVGPDYIDPAFHTAASARPCLNVDLWAMRDALVSASIARAGCEADLIIGEGVMGMFDGANGGLGSTAALAVYTGWPIVLVVDASGMSASAGAIVHGFATFRSNVTVAGVIFNQVGSPTHARGLKEAVETTGIPVLGCVPRNKNIELPARHLGLVQAAEHPGLDAFLERTADHLREHVALDDLVRLAEPDRRRPGQAHGAGPEPPPPIPPPIPPLGQRIAVARDQAFRFTYHMTLEGWRRAGAEVEFFSPLDNEGPSAQCDAVYLPGGYPELHAERLANNRNFARRLRDAAASGAFVYGECGGFMVLGKVLVDANGVGHGMSGLLPVVTSFVAPKLTLGYRELSLNAPGALGAKKTIYRGHEFHYARAVGPGPASARPSDKPIAQGCGLFQVRDARGGVLPDAGLQIGTVAGSFIHLVDRGEKTVA